MTDSTDKIATFGVAARDELQQAAAAAAGCDYAEAARRAASALRLLGVVEVERERVNRERADRRRGAGVK